MRTTDPGLLDSLPPAATCGEEIHGLAARIFPIRRSLTGDGVRETLHIMQEFAPFEIREVASGTRIFDWTVPPEWKVSAAHITDLSTGCRVVDVADHSLHLMGHSAPVDRTMTLAELRPYLHSLPNQPDLIPYRTSYYHEAWGFCLSQRQLETMGPGPYRVVIDGRLDPKGSLTYGELHLPGASADEVLLSAHICHPSLGNDNCSGLAVVGWLARHLAARRNRLSYRILMAPAVLGSLTWLFANKDRLSSIKHGLVIANVGDGGGPTYKRSRRGNAAIDKAAELIISQSAGEPRILDFSPYGYDERQLCSPGFNMPVGTFQRSRWGQFPEYHTSADNLDFIRPHHLAESVRQIVSILDVLETNTVFKSTMPFGEPQLGKRGLYDDADGRPLPEPVRMAFLWVLNLADGEHSLLDMATRSKLPYAAIRGAADRLREAGLLEAIAN